MQLKVYRKDNRKRDQQPWRRRARRAGILAGAVLAGLVFYLLSGPLVVAVTSTRDFIVDNPYFSVREIQVRGGSKVSGNEIVTIAGLKQGMNIWKVDPAAIEQKVIKHPWVRRVLVRREFPRRIVIEVEERIPKAIVALRKLYYVDADGIVFKEVGVGENVQYPLLTGLRAERLVETDPLTRQKIKEALRLGDLMSQRSRSLSEIHFDASGRVAVYTTNFPVALRMGWGDWEEKLGRMDRLLSLWKGNEGRLSSLDMSYRDQVVARLRQRQPQ
ncbi:MAG: cell division protein FtsQ/DivIB [Candidatus Binatia bacterium]